MPSQEEELLAGQARWCRRYARANAAGLRKIAKKHDKRAANDAGRRFVQVMLSPLLTVLVEMLAWRWHGLACAAESWLLGRRV